MALLAVQQQGAKIGWRDGALTVLQRNEELQRKPVHEVSEVHLYGAVDLTARARDELLLRSIDVLYFARGGTYRGRLLGAESANAQRRAAQYRTLADGDKALQLARQFVAAKILNARSLLQRVRRERPEASQPQVLAALRQMHRRAPAAASLEILRGIEGRAATVYFRGFAAALSNPAFPFPRRSRRPPRDAVNACLSFGYTLLLTRVDTAVRKAGLDPHLGALHDPGRGKPSLALDLMEELRPLVIDRLVLRLINRRQLSPDDFVDPAVSITSASTPPAGDETDPLAADPAERAVYLGPVGRAVLLRELWTLWRTPVRAAHDGQLHQLGDLIDRQAVVLAQVLEGERETYEPLALR